LFDVPRSRGDWVRELLRLTPDQPLVVYTGTLGRVNGLNYAVEMARCLSETNIHFLLVGDGIEADQIKRRAVELGVLDRNLTLWDPIAKTQVPDILAAATVATSFVIPVQELWDNSANKFFDGLAAGRPVIINHAGWLADLLRETGAGLVLPPGDPIRGAALLAEFLQDKSRVAKAEAAARRLAREQFDRDRLANDLERILLSTSEN
jgi:glycosyltransferase involved in cell wall biosynthesis